MKTKIYMFIALVFLVTTFAKSQNKTGSIKVTVTEKKQPKEALPFASAILYSGETKITGTTDLDGNLTLKEIAPGKYNLKVGYVGFEIEQFNGIEIKADKTTYVSIAMKETYCVLDELVITEYSEPLIDPSTSTGCYVERCCFCGHCCSCISSTSYGVIEGETPVKSLKYYPNPTNGKITLEANDEIEELAIVDESGKLREQYVITKNDKLEKDLSNYTNGLYILQYQSKGKLYREKILVIH